MSERAAWIIALPFCVLAIRVSARALRYASGLPASRQMVSSSVEKVLLRVRALDRTPFTML